MTYKPIFKITSQIIKYLGKIEASREIVEDLNIPLPLEEEFRKDAFAKMTHYSTKIEGNRLTLKQTKELLAGKDVTAREIDKREVMNYYDCLEWIYNASRSRKPITENDIKQMHSLIQKGILKGKLRGEYREAQNAIYDSRTKKPVYFPPETKDVGPLMKSFVKWLNEKSDLHPVLKAGIAHYQFAVIHPFMDGNGRTARALATLILYREGYDLKKFYSLEEYYAEDLQGYYQALQRCHSLYYDDQLNPDITPWVDYFTKGVTVVFEEVKEKALEVAKQHLPKRSRKEMQLLQAIGPREKRLLAYFQKSMQLRTKNICSLFHIKDRSARDLLAKWIDEGLIERKGTGKRDAYYVLSADYRHLIGEERGMVS